MAEYSNELGMYLPSSEDNIDVVGSLKSNFEILDAYAEEKKAELQQIVNNINSLEAMSGVEEMDLSAETPYIRYKNGLQMLWKPRFTVNNRRGTGSQSLRLEEQFQFSAPFLSGEDVHAHVNFVYYNNLDTGLSYETNTHMRVREINRNNCLIVVGRSDGERNFAYPDGVSVVVSVMAMGRWK